MIHVFINSIMNIIQCNVYISSNVFGIIKKKCLLFTHVIKNGNELNKWSFINLFILFWTGCCRSELQGDCRSYLRWTGKGIIVDSYLSHSPWSTDHEWLFCHLIRSGMAVIVTYIFKLHDNHIYWFIEIICVIYTKPLSRT